MWKKLKHYRPKYKWSPRESTWGNPVLMSNWNRGNRRASIILPTHQIWVEIIYSYFTEDPDWCLVSTCHPNGMWLGLPRDVTFDVIVKAADIALDALIERSNHRISKGEPEPFDTLFVNACQAVLA